jgi:uncharacterized membrane protein/mono/diheme cytochrome c family protein
MNLIELIGRFHPVLVHLPIGIFVLVIVMDGLTRFDKFAYLSASIRLILGIGILSAILSLVTGYTLSLEGSNNQDLVDNHQWTAIGTTALFTAYYFLRHKLMAKRLAHTYTLLLLLLMLAWTGHQGGSLTHGEGFLTEGILEDKTIAETQLNIKDINQAVVYKDLVQYTLNQKCVQCHGIEKQKGKLRLDDLSWIKAGGKNGNLINTANPADGELIKRILLDDIDEHHMPPKEKTQLTDAEMVIFQWWINTGASFDKSVAALSPDAKVIKALASFKDENQNQVKTTIKTREPIEAIDKKIQKRLEKMGWVVSTIAAEDYHIRLIGYNIETSLKDALGAAAEISDHIIELKLSFSSIKDNDLTNLSKFKNIEKLWLDHTAITDNSLNQLKALEYLEYLNIVGTNTTANVLRSMMQMPNLKIIYAQGTKITAEERFALESIKSNAKLYFGDSMKSAITDTIFAKKAE